MNEIRSWGRFARLSTALVLGFAASNFALYGAEVSVLRTNVTERWITNVIEVKMPTNRFVTEYHTNWVEQVRQNPVAVYKTNVVTRNVTNNVAVDAFKTNHTTAYSTNLHNVTATNLVTIQSFNTNVVNRYSTNWMLLYRTNVVTVDRTLTNFVDSYHTNLKSLFLTNVVNVERPQTNFVSSYRTNFKTLNVTNYETVFVMKTNWVTQHVTNAIEYDVQTKAPESKQPASAPKEDSRLASSEIPGASTAPVLTDLLELEAHRTERPASGNTAEIEIKVHWIGENAGAPIVGQNWRVEREDGAILCFGQERDFKRELPAGSYRVEVFAQKDDKSPLLRARGTLVVNRDEASIRQKQTASR
jgi:hypothetical protein